MNKKEKRRNAKKGYMFGSAFACISRSCGALDHAKSLKGKGKLNGNIVSSYISSWYVEGLNVPLPVATIESRLPSHVQRLCMVLVERTQNFQNVAVNNQCALPLLLNPMGLNRNHGPA
jgi:hypothetical protein